MSSPSNVVIVARKTRRYPWHDATEIGEFFRATRARRVAFGFSGTRRFFAIVFLVPGSTLGFSRFPRLARRLWKTIFDHYRFSTRWPSFFLFRPKFALYLYLPTDGVQRRETRIYQPSSSGIPDRFHDRDKPFHLYGTECRTWVKLLRERIRVSNEKWRFRLKKTAPKVATGIKLWKRGKRPCARTIGNVTSEETL